MNNNTKLEIAVEIIAAQIALCAKNGCTLKSSEMQTLIEERDEMYKGNEIVIDKIIKLYGPKIKSEYEKIKIEEKL